MPKHEYVSSLQQVYLQRFMKSDPAPPGKVALTLWTVTPVETGTRVY